MPDRAAFDSAASVQRQFEQEFAGNPNILGIGLGLNSAADALVISVQVSEPPAVGSIPTQFGGLEVLVIVVGRIEAL